MTYREVYISLGSNLGNRRENIENALAEIAKTESTKIKKCSSFYETAPWGYTDQPSFYNVVVLLETALEPETLLERLLQIEQMGGRERLFTYAPRTIDIDILLAENFTSSTQRLTVPHPRLTERAFVLVPLAEIAGENFEKSYGFSPRKLIENGQSGGVIKLS